MNDTKRMIKDHKIIGIVRGVEKENIVKMAEALYEGGIRLIEVTFNQNDQDNLVKTSELIRVLVEKSDIKCV